jgi:hypothetical protein
LGGCAPTYLARFGGVRKAASLASICSNVAFPLLLLVLVAKLSVGNGQTLDLYQVPIFSTSDIY